MAQEWFYKFTVSPLSTGETVGPLSTSEFREHAADRRVQPDTLVTRDGADEWVSADRIKGLFDADGVLLPPPENTGGQELKRHPWSHPPIENTAGSNPVAVPVPSATGTPIENTMRKAEQSIGETKDAERYELVIKWRAISAIIVVLLAVIIAVSGVFQDDDRTEKLPTGKIDSPLPNSLTASRQFDATDDDNGLTSNRELVQPPEVEPLSALQAIAEL
jgi:hypothetical protein